MQLEIVVVNSILTQPLHSFMNFFALLEPFVKDEPLVKDVQGGLQACYAAYQVWQVYKTTKFVLHKSDQNSSFCYLEPSSDSTIVHRPWKMSITLKKNIPFNPSTVLGKYLPEQASHSWDTNLTCILIRLSEEQTSPVFIWRHAKKNVWKETLFLAKMAPRSLPCCIHPFCL